MNPGIDPVAFHIGPWPVHWYGIIFAFVIVLGTLLAANEAARRGENPELVWDGVLIVVLLGLIGGRLYHVIHEWDALYRDNLTAVFFIWNGGLAIYGGVAGGFLGLVIFARSARLNLARWLDIAALGLILAQAIGRWGNFINRELYGTPTDLPWAVYIEPQYRVAGYEGFDRFHPLFMYESLWNFGVFFVLIYLTRRSRVRLLDGDVTLLYLMLYSLGRFFLEAVKIGDVWTIAGLRTAQIIAIALMAGCGIIFAIRRRALPPQTTGQSAE